MEQGSFGNKLVAGFAVTLVLLAILCYSSFRAISEMEDAHNWEVHTQIVIKQANTLWATIMDADEARLLSTMNPVQKRPAELSRLLDSAGPQALALKKLTSDNPFQQKQTDSLRRYVNLWASGLNDKSKLASGGLLLPSNYRAQVRLWLNRVVSEEDHLMASRRKQSLDDGKRAGEIIAATFIVALVFFIFFFRLIWNAFASKKAARMQLALSESKFHNAFEYSGVGMAIVSPEGQWVNVNNRLSEMLGYTKEELVQKSFPDITHPEDLKADVSLLKQLQRKEIPMYQMEKRYLHKESFIVWVMLTVSAIWDEDNKLKFHIAQIADITAVKKLIEELQVKNKTLSVATEQLNGDIRQMRDFNSIVAHNLRGPAASIINIAELLLTEESEEERKELTEMLLSTSKALTDTLKDLMQLLEVRLNVHAKREPARLKPVLDSSLGTLNAEIIRSKARIVPEFKVKEVNFPKIYLESIFYNMISNSLKYKRDGIEPVIKISSGRENGHTTIVFEDNGLGIDLKKNGKDMFKFSKTFHTGFDSKGVGLHITKNQLEMYGGTIAVESEPGHGTKFIITI